MSESVVQLVDGKWEDGSEHCGPFVYAVVGVGAGGCRVAQLKSCRTSLVGGVSAGCLGSMSKLQGWRINICS